MQSLHKAVLLHEVVRALVPSKETSGDKPIYLDGTLGGCGHALAISEALHGKLTVVGLDMDETAIERGRELLRGKASEVILENENFRNLDSVLHKHGIAQVDMMLLDLGLSSDELDRGGRGFSFQKDEPLHMTMGDPARYPFTAKDIVNGWSEEDIANVIFAYGEEKYAKRIAKRLVEYRTKTAINTSAELAEIVKGAVPRNFGKVRIHPATRTFQALRIAVNDELKALKEGLQKGYEHLNENGRMAVISFHSLEDRIVKDFYKARAKSDGSIVSKKPEKAVEEEVAENPRARSAKLRILIKKAKPEEAGSEE